MYEAIINYIFLQKTHIKMIPFGGFELKYIWSTNSPFRLGSEEPEHPDTGKHPDTGTCSKNSSANRCPWTRACVFHRAQMKWSRWQDTKVSCS